ncbi:unnamed protein product [Dicrocoelium dendriticum]|nr:unnamed protein product [Dicrocoelium dendriticum]
MDGDIPTDATDCRFSSPCDDLLVDITERFTGACKIALKPGELCCNSWFTLQHAMSAIEIMDPKMDIRVVGARRIMCTTEHLTTGTLPLDRFEDISELIGIMDELLACVVNWLTGDSLAQSVFISMYMHCTQLICDPYLSAFCELLRHNVTRLRHFIVSTGSFDEEDHYAPTLGMPMYEPSPAFNRFLKTQQDSDCIQHSTELGRLDCTDDLIANLPELNSSTGPKLLSCLRIRLNFIRKFADFLNCLPLYARAEGGMESTNLETNSHLSSAACPGPQTYDTDTSIPYSIASLSGTEQFWISIESACANCLKSLKSLNQIAIHLVTTVSVGKSSGRGRTQPKDFSYGLPGFEPLLNQTHLPSYIPRFVVIHERPAAFTYLLKLTTHLLQILDSIQCIARLQPRMEMLSTPHPLWALLRAHGQNTCSYLTELLHGPQPLPSYPAALPVSFNSCVLSRSVCYSLYSASLHNVSLPDKPMSLQAVFVLNAWMALEPERYRLPIRNLVCETTHLADFLDLIGEHLAQIPRVYCLNRSRQRSVLIQWLEKMPSLMHECMRMQLMVAMELAKKFDWANVQQSVSPADDSFKPIDLQVVSLICYYYYHLAWDYIISGFQLELYSSYEWVPMYTFLIQLLQQLSTLMERLATLSAATISPNMEGTLHVSTDTVLRTNHCTSLDGETKEPTGDKAVCPLGRGRKKNRKGRSRHHAAPLSSEGANNNEAVDCLPDRPTLSFCWHKFCGPLSSIELLLLTVHRFLVVGTTYALRALQLDSGGDPVLDTDAPEPFVGFANAAEIYGRRLGLFLLVPNSPLMSPSGFRGSFSACKQYVTTGIFSGPTTALYEQAALNYDNARLRVQLVSARFQHDLDIMVAISGAEKTPFMEDMMQQLFGTPDRLSQLDRLANHNSVACRVLAQCPDRRPKPAANLATPGKYFFPLPSSPVQLNFDFLPSRVYPLIRLQSASSRPSVSVG